MMMKTKLFACLAAVLALTLLAHCGRRTVAAKKMTPSMTAYIYAYTSGTISREAPVRVRFTAPLVGADKIGTAVDGGVLDISPAVKGTTVWEDAQTIRFTPADAFEAKTSYLAEVKVKRLFNNVPSDAEQFEFDFQTREMYFDVDLDGITPENGNDMTKQSISGDLLLSDAAEEKMVEGAVTATENGAKLQIDWQPGEGLRHNFKIRNIARGDQPQKVIVRWDGKSFGTDVNGEKTLEIPAINDFKTMDAKVGEDEGQQYVKLYFSDPLNAGQDLKGLINFGEMNPATRYSIDGNQARVYLPEYMEGDKIVNVQAGIKNYRGDTLKQPSAWTLQFSDIKPSVRLVGRGVIMPNSNGLNFPFEAVNLNYVDVEIFKIFNNNILQFLQANDLAGENDDQLEHVGRVVLRQRVSLHDINPSASTRKWTHYAVDLSKLIKADPTAIYQVRIGFRPGYSDYVCSAGKGSGKSQDNLTVLQPPSDGSEEIPSMYDYNWNGGVADGGGNYDYRHEGDPCYPQYYNRNHFIRRNVLVSDLGIIAKKGSDGSIFVAVSDLLTANVKEGVKLDFYDKQNQLMTTAMTAGDGTAHAELKGQPYVVVATAGEQKGYLPLSDQNSLNLSRFDVAGNVTQKGLKGFLYGDRGVWRPGDSLYLNFIMEDKTGKLPADYPVTLELYDPKGSLQYRVTSMTNVKNIYPFTVATRADAPTGAWRADIKAGGATFSEPIRIETVKPNRLKLNLDLGKKEIAAGDERLDGKLQVNWLHGAPGKGLKAKIEANLVAVPTHFDKYKEYVFDSPVRKFKSEPQVVFDGVTDDAGYAKVSGALPKGVNAPGKMKANFKMRAFEPGGDFSSDFMSLDYSPYAAYVGVNIPQNAQKEKRIDMGKPGAIGLVMVDKSGAPLKNRSVDVSVYRVDWRWWWEHGEDAAAEFSSAKDLKIIKQAKLTTSAAGEASLDVQVDQWGRYLVLASDAAGGHNAGDYFYAGYPWNDDQSAGQSRNNAAMLSFSTNKEKYAVGDEVELNIPTGDAGRALISIENGSKVLTSSWISVKSGVTKYHFTATAEMAPTVYAFVTIVQPHNQVKNDLPIRMFGVSPIHVEDPKTRLNPVLKMADALKPEEKATLEVSEQSGKPMAYTIDIVDEGLLDLTHHQTPNPWNVFYGREALGVQTFDVYDQVLGAYGGQIPHAYSIGGDAAKNPRNTQKANRFKPVVLHLGPFYLASGSAKHTVTIPNYVGSVRAMVVAANSLGAYGSAEKTTPVKKPLMILATLPRVLGPGEKLQLPVDVFAMDPKVKNVTLSVKETSGLAAFSGPTTKNIAFTRPDDQVAEFDLQVAQKIGVAHFKISAEGGGETTSQDIEIDVRNPNPVVTDVKEQVLAASANWSQSFNALGVEGTNKTTLEVSVIPPIDLASRLRYLLEYPYGCVEQTTSAAFPQLYVNRLMQLSDGQKKLADANVRSAIESLKKFQTAGGGFAYWPGEEQADYWSSSYAGHFLLEAKAAGYTLPPNMIERWQSFQQKTARRWDPQLENRDGWGMESAELNQAYRLYTLALAKAPEAGAMNSLRERKTLGAAARWRLAAAYAMSGKPEIVQQLTTNIPTTVNKYREMAYTFGSELRDEAMILETMILSGNQNGAARQAREVAQSLSSGDWYGTQSVAYGLLAMSKYVGAHPVPDKFSFDYAINGKTGTMTSTAPVTQIEVAANASNNKITVKNNGKGQLYVRLIQKGVPPTGDKTAVAQNLNMAVVYKTLKGEVLNPAAIRQGVDFVAEVTVTNPGTVGKKYKEMALSQIFPSGWEIHNARMDVLGATAAPGSVPRYQDIRDDRVNTYFDIAPGKPQVYRVQLNAAYAGRYYLPSVNCEAMYDNNIQARTPGMWVEVTPDAGKKAL